MAETKKIKPDLITFDVYSALVDYSSGLKDIFSECSGLSSKKSLSSNIIICLAPILVFK